ncbi:MAG: hypothetical protein GC159_22075 [Phycisphaera sp.]|nr:hypothetical protein [Phycisphaera sp.]
MGYSVRTQIGWVHALLLALLVVGSSVHAYAQGVPGPQLPGNVVGADQIGGAQQTAIDEYVRFWVGQMNAAKSPAAIAEARTKLVQPIANPLSSAAFKAAYYPSVIDKIAPLVKHKDPVVQMNVLIVVAHLRTNKISDIAIEGLQIKNAGFGRACRYWAAKAIADAGQGAGAAVGGVFIPQQEKKILDVLKNLMVTEKSDYVLEQMYLALGALSLDDATSEALKILATRLSQHHKKIEAGLRADEKGLSNLYTRLTIDDALGKDVKPRLRELTKVAAMYLQVIAEQMQKKQVSDEMMPVCNDIIEIGGKIMKMAIEKLDPTYSGSQPDLMGPVGTGNFTELLFNVQLWTGTKETPGIISKSKVGIPYADVEVK